jgi:hypothetical protein
MHSLVKNGSQAQAWVSEGILLESCGMASTITHRQHRHSTTVLPGNLEVELHDAQWDACVSCAGISETGSSIGP